jgi:hypothetical protein
MSVPCGGEWFLCMHVEHVQELVEVLAVFRRNGMEPVVFKWGGKRYRVTKVNLMHTLNDGRERIHYFSVSGEGANYRLAYRPLAFRWTLEEVWLE